MLSRIVDAGTVAVTAQDADDLLGLRRIISRGDVITADTYRTIKREREYARPDGGQRVRLRISLEVRTVSLDTVDVLRISGTILKSNNEEIQHGSHHSMRIKISTPFVIYKKQWSAVEKKLVRARGDSPGAVLVAIDRSDCGIGRLDGAHLEIIPNIYSGSGGKQYKTESRTEKFFADVTGALLEICKKGDMVIVFGPGQTKNRLANHVRNKHGGLDLRMTEGVDSGGEDGIYTFIRSEEMKKMMAGSKIAIILDIVNSIMTMASRQSRKFTMGLEDTDRANQYGAIESIVFSDRALQDHDEDDLIRLLNDAESRGARVYSVDGSTDLGLRVNGMGGIISTLRFAVEA